jgi:hypothetical protein
VRVTVILPFPVFVLLGAGDAAPSRLVSASSFASWERRVLEGTRDGAREVLVEGPSRGPRLTLERASRSSSSECSLNGSRFSLTVPEKRTASDRQLVPTNARFCKHTLRDISNPRSLFVSSVTAQGGSD